MHGYLCSTTLLSYHLQQIRFTETCLFFRIRYSAQVSVQLGQLAPLGSGKWTLSIKLSAACSVTVPKVYGTLLHTAIKTVCSKRVCHTPTHTGGNRRSQQTSKQLITHTHTHTNTHTPTHTQRLRGLKPVHLAGTGKVRGSVRKRCLGEVRAKGSRLVSSIPAKAVAPLFWCLA